MSRTKRLAFETLERRQMLAGDLFYDPITPGTFDRIVFVDQFGGDLSGVADPTPVVGQKVYVSIDWSAVGLDPADTYFVQLDMDGEILDTLFFEPFSNTDYPALFHGGWIAQPDTTHTITVTLDPNNQVVETNEANNTFTLQFTTRDADDLPAKFGNPIAGTQNVDWVLGGYVDVDPGFFPDFEDHQGETNTTREGHNGLDIEVANFAAQDAGVQVIAAAPGMVIEAVDGDFDRETVLNFANAGNRVFIDHGDGWVSQYYHLRRDTVAVTVGQQVETGDVLGLVGSSGNSAGPHVHFEIQHHGSPVEPFIAPEQYFVASDFDNSGNSTGLDFLLWQQNVGTSSGATTAEGDANADNTVGTADLLIWESQYGDTPLPYVFDPVLPNNLLDFGVTNDIQDGVSTGFGLPLAQFIERPSEVEAFPGSSEWILAWGIFSSVEAGDTWEAQLYRPNGTLVNDFAAVTFASNQGKNSGLFNPGLTENIPGTWRVDFLYNDVKIGERTFEVGSSLPEMRVFEDGAGTYILDGRTTPIDFGSAAQGGSAPELTFKVENHGYADLTISGVNLPVGYSITESLSATIAAGTSDTFTVELDTSVVGSKTGQIVINSNDASEAAFEFEVEGEITAPLAAASLPASAFYYQSLALYGEASSETSLPSAEPARVAAALEQSPSTVDPLPTASSAGSFYPLSEADEDEAEEATDEAFTELGPQL